mgnify:CR=1 FL=1
MASLRESAKKVLQVLVCETSQSRNILIFVQKPRKILNFRSKLETLEKTSGSSWEENILSTKKLASYFEPGGWTWNKFAAS